MKKPRACMEDFASRKITRQLVTRGLGLPYGRICCRQPLRHTRRSTMLSTARKRPKIKVYFTSKSIKVLTTAPHTYSRVHRVYTFSISENYYRGRDKLIIIINYSSNFTFNLYHYFITCSSLNHLNINNCP